jgi:hypothetical protein
MEKYRFSSNVRVGLDIQINRGFYMVVKSITHIFFTAYQFMIRFKLLISYLIYKKKRSLIYYLRRIP